MAATLLLSISLTGDAQEIDRRLIRLAPTLDHGVPRHLLHDDDRAFREFCRAIGIAKTKDAIASLYAGVHYDTPDSYARDMRALYPHIRRLTSALDTEYDCPEYARIYAFRVSLGARGYEHRRLIASLERAQLEGVFDLDDKIVRYQRFASAFERFGDERELMTIEGALARDVMQEGGIAARVRLLRSALSRARRLGENVMVCQLLGELGYTYRVIDEPDSMLLCYREGIARADRHRIPDQATRLRTFLGQYYFDSGRLAAGADLFREAQAVCRKFGGGPWEIRAVLAAMSNYARLGCWDIVDRHAQRLPVLLRALARTEHDEEVRRYALQARRWSARRLAATGRAGEAADVLTQLCDAARSVEGREELGPMLAERAVALLDAGRSREALDAADEAAAYADSVHLPSLREPLAMTRARAALTMKDYDRARSALADAARRRADDPPSLLAPSIQDGLGARIAVECGERRTARGLLERGLSALRDSLAVMDRGPQADLAINEAEDLRRTGHQLFADDAAQGYRFELRWQSLASWIGGRPSRAPGDASAGTPVARGSEPFAHLLYVFAPEGLVRWTVTQSDVRRERLTLHTSEYGPMVERVVALASADPGDADTPMPEELRRLARRLGRLLLPPEVRLGAYGRLVISAEGVLGRLPFELLDASASGDYEPLLLRQDVSYARAVRVRRRMRNDGTSILAESAPPGGRRDRGGSLAPLPAVETELKEALARLPHGRVFRSGAVSKERLLAAWGDAAVVYVAAHLVRDPDAPLLSYFPIAFGAGSDHAEGGYLDLRDVRDTDLSGCRLVVLSSCASGEPYVVGGRSGPSMADVFLDAGALAVIHTRWRVRDASAANVAPRLAGAWQQRERFGPSGWRATRRGMMFGSRGLRHPFQWASWSVKTALPVPR